MPDLIQKMNEFIDCIQKLLLGQAETVCPLLENWIFFMFDTNSVIFLTKRIAVSLKELIIYGSQIREKRLFLQILTYQILQPFPIIKFWISGKKFNKIQTLSVLATLPIAGY